MYSKFSYSLDISPSKYHPDLKIYASDSSTELIAHRAVLASHSYLLKTAFISSDVEGDAVIILPDFSVEEVSQMIQLLYGQIAEIKPPSAVFSVLGLSPSCQESEYFVDQDESELVFDTVKTELIEEEPCKRRPRSRPKVFTDAGINLVSNVDDNEGGVDIDVDAYIINEPAELRPWVCHLCLISAAQRPNSKDPYRSMHKHNLKYHIIRKHFNMEIPKNWKCDLCAKKFISRSGLRQHKRDTCPMSVQAVPRDTQESRTPTPCEEPESDNESIVGSSTQMFECATCHNIFESIKEIEQHMQLCVGGMEVQQEEEVMYQCNECWEAGQEFIFPTMMDLNSHIESEHNDVQISPILEPEVSNSIISDQVESFPKEVESGEIVEHRDIVDAQNVIEESIDEEDNDQHENIRNCEGSVLVEGIVENESNVLFDDYDSQSTENPDIGTNEVLVQCEPSSNNDENSDEVTLVMIDENDDAVFCPVCDNGFSNSEVLAEHLSHHPTCPTCGEMVLSQSVLGQHLGTHHLCGVCGDRFVDLEVLEKHEQNHAEIDQAIRGDFGTTALKYQNPEIRDAISSIQSAPVIVSNDFIDGRKSAELIQEANPGFSVSNLDVSQDLDISSLLAQQNIRAQCDLCEKNFSNETVLDLHIQGAHGGYIQPVQNQESPKFQLDILENIINCNFCQETFSSMPELNSHTAALHREILEASQISQVPPQVNSQEQVAVRETLPPFNCTLCKDTFPKVGQLSRHINTNHRVNKLGSGKPFLCKLCGSNFIQLSTLEKHALVQHRGQEHAYECPECSKLFKHSAGLQSHLRVHSSVRLYQCGACTRTFNWEASLRTHIKKCEGGSIQEQGMKKKKKIIRKPEVNIEVGLSAESLTVKCSRCGEHFGDEDQFSEHTCPGKGGRGRRFRCNKCSLLFRSRKIIRRHLRSCEGVQQQQGGDLAVAEQRMSKRPRKAVKDDLFVTDVEGSDKELEDLVDSDAEDEFRLNAKEDYSESSDNSDGSSDDEKDDFTVEPSIKRYKVENKLETPGPLDSNENPKPKSNKKIYVCEFCEKVFKHGHHLKEHVMIHTNIFPFNCEECGRGFRRILGLERHCCSDPVRAKKTRLSVIQKTPVAESQPHVCGTCDMTFDKQQKFASHFRSSPMCRKLTAPSGPISAILDAGVPEVRKSSSASCLFNCSMCNFSTDDGLVLNQHLQSEKHVARVVLEEFNSSMAKYKCDLCMFTADTEYKFKRHILTRKHLDNKDDKTEEELLEKFKNPKIYTCLICEESFKDMVGLDEHVEDHKKDEEMTSRSGRKIKPKKFHDDFGGEGRKRKLNAEGKGTMMKRTRRSSLLHRSQERMSGADVDCGICGDSFFSHTAHFVHMLSHVPPEIVKSLPVVDGGGVGWCPYCPGPVQLNLVEQHMAEMHSEMEEDESSLGLKIGEKKLEFDEIDPEELESLELTDSDRCVHEQQQQRRPPG